MRAKFGVSERFACRALGQHRSTQRKIAKTPDDEAALTADIVALALEYGRYGYRRIAALLHDAGWAANLKRVERIWRREGLKVPAKQPKRTRTPHRITSRSKWLPLNSIIMQFRPASLPANNPGRSGTKVCDRTLILTADSGDCNVWLTLPRILPLQRAAKTN